LFLICLFVDRFLSTMGTAEPLRHPTKRVGISETPQYSIREGVDNVLQLQTIGMHPKVT